MTHFTPTFASFKKDQLIMVEGKKTDNFYIIREGKVRLSRDVSIDADSMEILNPGDFFGVISSMSGYNQIETATAMTDVSLIVVPKSQYQALIQKTPQVAMKIITQFSKKLRSLNDSLAKNTLKSTAEIEPSHLFNVAEYYYEKKQSTMAVYAYFAYLKNCPDGENAAVANERIEAMKATGAVISDKNYEENKTTRTYNKDAMLFAEGEPGEEMFIIQGGSIKITKIIDGNEIMLAMLKAGDILGEMALLEGKPRGANAIAHEDCSVMTISKSNFELMSKSQPALIEKVTVIFAERIWFIYKQLLNTLLDEPICRMYDALYIQMEKNRVPLEQPGKEAYTFNFGKEELVKMVGLPEPEGMAVLQTMLKEKSIEVADGKIQAISIQELAKQTDFYRKMDKREKAKKQSKENRNN